MVYQYIQLPGNLGATPSYDIEFALLQHSLGNMVFLSWSEYLRWSDEQLGKQPTNTNTEYKEGA